MTFGLPDPPKCYPRRAFRRLMPLSEYGFLKNQKDKFLANCGNGAIYFGWLGTLIGLIALTAGKWDNWGDIEKTGLALSVAMLTLLYGYIIKLITLNFKN